MAIVIVTPRAFLLCEDVISVTLQPLDTQEAYRQKIAQQARLLLKKNKSKTKKPRKPPVDTVPYQINITYYPRALPAVNGYSTDQTPTSLFIDIRGYREASKVFNAVVREIREQKPDERWLDQLVEQMLDVDVDEVVKPTNTQT